MEQNAKPLRVHVQPLMTQHWEEVKLVFRRYPLLHGLVVINDPLFLNRSEELVRLISAKRLPAIFQLPSYVTIGGLLRKSPVSRGSPLGSRFQHHTVPLAFEQLDRAACDAMSVAAVVVIGARFTVRRAFGEEMIDRPKHRVGHGHHGFLVPAMPHYASVSGLQRTVLRASRRCGGF